MSASAETYADKIAKLLRKAEGGTTPEEAEALIAKAQELMTRYAIDQAMVDAARGLERREEIIAKSIKFEGTYRKATAQILWAVLRANDCKGVYWDDTRDRYYNLEVAGFEGDVERVVLLNASLQIQCAQALNAWWRETDTSWWDRNRKFNERRQFVYSFAQGLAMQLQSAKRRATEGAKAEQTDGGVGMELVLRSRQDQVKDWFDRKHGKLRSVPQRYQAGGSSARQAGMSAGRTADVNRPKIGNRKAIGAKS